MSRDNLKALLLGLATVAFALSLPLHYFTMIGGRDEPSRTTYGAGVGLYSLAAVRTMPHIIRNGDDYSEHIESFVLRCRISGVCSVDTLGN